MATSAQHQNKVFFILCFIRSLVFPTTATLLLLGATVYLVFYTFHQESLMGFVPPAMVGLLSLISLKSFCYGLHVSSKHCESSDILRRPQNFQTIYHLFDATTKKVGDCFKFVWSSQNIQTFLKYIHSGA